ncbi:hypothetical protein MELA_01616 [Candidatus Methylomirabilis lanthanidiphila]|uniref:Uncharacterized protein n=1 Tax=Candidatus Methylomirabilis lanthanidiphila TaxID=2211376 RepID=A0A564ZIW6_9BACT|nr:hypothetical protein MELA_01616 [Candidatus Methylomirabilis lanthanidiphila]
MGAEGGDPRTEHLGSEFHHPCISGITNPLLQGMPPAGRGRLGGVPDLDPARRFVVYPGDETYPIGGDTSAIPLDALARQLAEETA